jgi:hypothetical protein
MGRAGVAGAAVPDAGTSGGAAAAVPVTPAIATTASAIVDTARNSLRSMIPSSDTANELSFFVNAGVHSG